MFGFQQNTNETAQYDKFYSTDYFITQGGIESGERQVRITYPTIEQTTESDLASTGNDETSSKMFSLFDKVPRTSPDPTMHPLEIWRRTS